jgi:hypothetical protein
MHVVFIISSMQVSGQYIKLGHNHFLPLLFHFHLVILSLLRN